MTERDVAIIGMACVFPKAPDLATFWRNIRDGVDAITDVPAARWDPLFYDPASTAPDRFYARRGGFIDEYAKFDAAGFGIMPIAAQGAEPDQLLALEVAVAAIADAGYAERPFARDKTNIIVGRGNYLGPGIVRLVNITRGAQQLVDSLHELLPGLDAEQLAKIKSDFHARCGIYGADTAIGLVPNLVASRIANRLDLGGSAYTIDAACASTLIAVDQACRELRDGEADVAIAGGVHLCHDMAFWSVFSQLGALSRSQQIRPFDRRADGLLIGEGIGMFVLKRLSDARAADDRIYAVIRGTGVASDGRDVSLLTPRIEGQTLALTRAWKAAGLDPDSVGLIEAHGTATAAGDAAELATLGRFFGPGDAGRERVALGSVKSMIGHAMPAAGAAGLIKAALAVYHGVKPPTLHCEDPHPAIAATRFRTLPLAEPWDDATRRAAVNAFGFGGINAHVIVDAAQPRPRAAREVARVRDPRDQALVVAASSQAALLKALDDGRAGDGGPWRLAVFDPTPKKLAAARAAVESGKPRHGRDGLYFAPGGLIAQGGKVAFLFPGVEAVFAPSVDDVAAHFDMPAPDLTAKDLEHIGASVIALNHFLDHVMGRIGVLPDLVAGHSIGEWSGMLATGMVENARFEDFLEELQPGTLEVAAVTYVAVGAGADRLAALIADQPAVIISHDNCVHQTILCGPQAQIDVVVQRMREARILFEVLPFRSGFHSPALEEYVGFYIDHLLRFKLRGPSIPFWSATTVAPYPSDPDAIRTLFHDHLVRPVRFRELILALFAQGVRVFVQVGTGSLTAFVDDVLAGEPHRSVALVSPHHSGMEQIRRACASLYVEGADLDLASVDLAEPARAHTRQPMSLALSVPLIRLDLPPLPTGVRHRANGHDHAHPLAAAFDANLDALASAQDAIEQAFARMPAASPAKVVPAAPANANERTETMILSAAAYPELVDHCLIPQPPGWPTLADWAPAVPMTMSVALLMEAAAKLDPTRIPIAIENVQANKWLHVEPAVEVVTTAKRIDANRIDVKIGAYVGGVVTMGDRYPDRPAPSSEALVELRAFPVAAGAIYSDGWLFHGPRYQGIATIEAFGSNGVRGMLRALDGKGSLLDNAGQLIGLWVMQSATSDRLAMPLRIGRIDFYGPEPAPGELVNCTAWMRHLGRREARGDLELTAHGSVYARVTGWEDWRFHTGGGIFEVMRQPGLMLLAQPEADDVVVVTDPGWATATTEFLTRRYLSTAEAATANAARQAQRGNDHLYGRIAAKDAIRRHLFARGHGPVFPVEVAITSDAHGRPLASGPWTEDLRVSIAHKSGVACAIVAEGVDPGIDIEKIEERGDGFAALAFTADELRLLPAHDRAEWMTRLWAAKEAAGKAGGGGLAGDPKRLQLTALEDERMLVAGRWLETRKLGEYAMAWTVQ